MKSSFILILGTIIFWGFWGFFGKLSASKIGGQGSFWNAVSLIIVNFIFLLTSRQIPPFKTDSFGIITGLLAGAFSAVASVFFYMLLKHKPAGAISAAVSLYPLVTVLLSVLFLKESLGFFQIIGIIFAVIGLIFLNL